MQARLDLPYYDADTMELSGSQKAKAKKLFELGCVQRVSDTMWKVLPIKNYNSTTYSVWRHQSGSLMCSCQFFQSAGKPCSHIMAVLLSLREDI